MRICDLTSASGRFMRNTTHLKEVWQDSKADWNDARRREFQEHFLDELPPLLTLTMAAVHRFAEVVRQAEKELTDEQQADSFL